MALFTADDCSISVKGLSIFARHGVMEQERTVGNTFSVDVTLHYDAARAMDSDNVDDALNYAHVADIITAQMRQPSNLLENVAARIADALLDTFPALTRGTITITKPKPPFPAQVTGAAFSLTFHRHQ